MEDKTIPHQGAVEAVIDAEIAEHDQTVDPRYALRGTATIASPTAPGGTYSQTEMASLKTAIDAIRAQLSATHVTA